MSTPPIPRPQRWTTQTIHQVQRWAPALWSLRTGKPEGFRFTPGHYARLGLPVAGSDPIWRPYSIVSAPAESHLEFLITLVRGGAFTGLLAAPDAPDNLMVESAVMGFFLPEQFAPGGTLWMLATGAGLGPYVSILREGGIWRDFRRIVLVHGVRRAAELAYAAELQSLAGQRPDSFRYVPTVTREPGAAKLSRCIPQLISDGTLEDLVAERLDAASSRVMVCGNPAFTVEMRQLLTARSFQPCRRGFTGSMLFERYW